MKIVSVHIGADLSQWMGDDEVLIRWLVNPDFGGSWCKRNPGSDGTGALGSRVRGMGLPHAIRHR